MEIPTTNNYIIEGLEKKFDVNTWTTVGRRYGYLFNIRSTNLIIHNVESEAQTLHAGVHLYFVDDDGLTWRTSFTYRPYFYVAVSDKVFLDSILSSLEQKFEKLYVAVTAVEKIDLSATNHLSPFYKQENKTGFLKLSFFTIQQLTAARDELRIIVRHNKELAKKKRQDDRFGEARHTILYSMNDSHNMHTTSNGNAVDSLQYIYDVLEGNVRYISRVCIDTAIRCGCWYEVTRSSPLLYITPQFTRLDRTSAAPLSSLAWDIECSKEPLKFPNAEKDEITLISYCFNGQGYLIVNREGVSKDIQEFQFSPTDALGGPGTFKIFNETNELNLLKRFFQHIVLLKPHILATYNGDNFDFRYVHRRSQLRGLNMEREIGIMKRGEEDYPGHFILNLDCYKWVERDSYLPSGSRGLKAVCKAKLRFDPVEIDPEDMVRLAREDPQRLAVYSVSDAVATYYLYEKYIHRFILALCFIIPLPPEDVLRQGSGTLCEHLLMAEAYDKGIIFPNKHEQKYKRYWKDPKTQKLHLIFDDSYVGGKVESLKCGIYRDDLEEYFSLDPSAFSELIDSLDETFEHWCTKEMKSKFQKSDFLNCDEVFEDIKKRLLHLKEQPFQHVCPRIYHLDVGAMYPNIILTHRLQPPSIVNESTCAKCYWKREASTCQKVMKWNRKLEISAAEKGSILPILQDMKSRLYKISDPTYGAEKPIENEAESDGGSSVSDLEETQDKLEENEKKIKHSATYKTWNDLSERQQHFELIKAVKLFSLRAHKRTKVLKEVSEESIVCQRENAFYVECVRQFRDRRYGYKKTLKQLESEKKELLKSNKFLFTKLKELDDKILLNDSLQLAHKCILNSFYGYVKRGGSRWYSQEIGAIVTHTGASIIEAARVLLDRIGIPIELDTDGIWCMLPTGFPEVFELKLKKPLENGKTSIDFEYITSVLNLEVARRWTNTQYLEYEGDDEYTKVSKNEVFFELDGPWYGIFLPASEKSDDLLKKRYVVYNHNSEISELKGFEIKRRGELQVIQNFQREIFPEFMNGSTKEEVYANVAAAAMRWRELLHSHGAAVVNEEELTDLIVARTVLNKSVASQPTAKSMGITAARRLAELLENTSFIEESPVFTRFVVTAKPIGAERTARAVPIQVFQTEAKRRKQFLSKWLNDKNAEQGVRELLDWGYYQHRLDVQLQKLICIPALKQGIKNPIESVAIPEWLRKQQAALNPRQQKITHFFTKSNGAATIGRPMETDIEDLVASDKKENKRPFVEHNRQTKLMKNTKQESEKFVRDEVDKMSQKELKQMFTNEFGDWLRIQQMTWKSIRQNILKTYSRINKFKLSSIPSAGLNLLLRKFTLTEFALLMNHPWHLIDFTVDQHDPGLFHCTVCIMEAPTYFNIPINVRRRIYVNSLKPWEKETTENVSVNVLTRATTLPRDVKQQNLVELEMNESYFQDKKYTISASIQENVGGIYELKVPLEFDFLSRCGAIMQICTTNENAAIDRYGHVLSSCLSTASTEGNFTSYLQNTKLIYVHIFHGTSQAASKEGEIDRIFAAIYDSSSSAGSTILFGGVNQQQHTNFNANEAYKTFVEQYRIKQKAMKTSNGPMEVVDEVSMEYEQFKDIRYLTDEQRVLRQLELTMYEYKASQESGTSKYLVYLYSTLPRETLGNWAVDKRFAVLPSNVIASKYSKFPRRSFITDCFTASIELLFQHIWLVEERLAFSRFANIPIGWLLRYTKFECYQKIYDISYAQRLRENHALLWASDEITCDLGHPFLTASSYSDFDLTNSEDRMVFAHPGVYRGFGAEFFFGETLIFNASRLSYILNPEYLCTADWSHNESTVSRHKLEISRGSINALNENSKVKKELHNSFPESGFTHSSQFSPAAFKVLSQVLELLSRSLIKLRGKVMKSIWRELEGISSHYSSWLSDSSSLLYDPALYQKVLFHAELYFNDLVSELRDQHGILAVHGTLKSLAVTTGEYAIEHGKRTMEEALLRLTEATSIYSSINFDAVSEYVSMIQFDKRYYIRYRSYDVPSQETVNERLEILDLLPYAVDTYIRHCMYTIAVTSITELFSDLYDELDEGIPSRLNEFHLNELNERMKKIAKSKWILPGSLFKKVVNYLSDPQSFANKFTQMQDTSEDPLLFPDRIGSQFIVSGNWKLELVKFLVHLMELDSALEIDTAEGAIAYDERRHTLYELACASEYDPNNHRFRGPTNQLLLKDVKCRNCNFVNDLDLLFELEEIIEGSAVYRVWRCPYCFEEYLHDQIEGQLLMVAEENYCAYHAQDLICSSCNTVINFPRLSKCRCGGNATPRLNGKRWSEFCSVVQELAVKAGFILIQQSISQLAYIYS